MGDNKREKCAIDHEKAASRKYGSLESPHCSQQCDVPTFDRGQRRPKRVIHFSNGVIEEYSDNESETPDYVDTCSKSTADLVAEAGALVPFDNSNYYWFNQLSKLTSSLGRNTLQVCDYLGEKLASMLGITTPKYEYEIEEYKRMCREERAYKEKQKELYAGWTQSNESEDPLTQTNLVISSDKHSFEVHPNKLR
ncbi:hypothetical protein B4U79_15146 [Dinothrombium tinctorium]|uniref:Protein FAM177A1-like protein n=1 Tax=Dinothrombium tinctorium TaxID=1965070 RepID=A0A443RMQ5_9ACAR|nr:hypothetical protein B4U79_15146 [Dinothrombium tinctorium]